ncbi:putative Ig domain-containing protein [Pedobacter rhodius]|uniref:Ig domain-containing protein n=1 Tax=Pedobacter rhodius TaxID=3004098 RepID=A0ABT4KXM5_9SPHI|nr:putative Ig domain-containing protein [Pedobacter sp. SJ11]MCZ4222628.1 putative Ig domain-containing protein [Pedobacter sp. SJ11]
MMKNSTPQSFLRKIFLIPLITIVSLLTLLKSESYSQTKIYANALGVTSNVDNASNALTPSETTFATVRSSGGTALSLGAYTGELELKFPATLPAGTTSFIRIDADPTLLNQLLGGNLGGLLSGVVGGVALGNHSIEAGARNSSGTTVLSGSSTGAFTTPNLRLVTDANGYFYMALRPSQDYDRVYIRDVTSALLLGTLNNTKVYHAFYTNGIDVCAPAFATDFEGNGLTVDVLGLGKAGVTNPNFAIDASTTNYSELSLGALGVAGSISQNFYFNTPSNAGDDFNLRFSVSSALLTAGVLNSLTVTAYNGNNQVYTQSAANVLSLDLLTLLGGGQPVTAAFSPGVPFDRVKVTLSSLLNANLTQTVLIYGLTKSAGRPTFTLPATNNVTTCYNTTAGLTATTSNTNELRWYDVIQGGTVLATTAYNGTFTTPALTANKVYYVAARRIGCTEESVRVPVSITVNPAIVFNSTTLINASNGFAYAKQIDAATGGTPAFTYALTNGSSLPAGLSLSSSGLISGTPTVTGSFTFSITATDSKGCSSTAGYTLVVTPGLALAPGTLPNGTTGVLYPTQVIPPATGGTGPYVYSAVNLPPGLTFNANTREITGTPMQTGIYAIPVTVTDATGNSVTASYTIKITDPLTLPSATLANGTTGQAYPTQVIPSAAGGSTPYVYVATNLPPGLSFNPSTREITGTPTTAGTYTIPVTATDADGRTVSTNYTIIVTDPLLLPSATLAGGTAGTVYPTQVIPSATGGVGPYTYVATSIPAGLTFNATTREITGTPTQAGNYTISVTVTDSQGRTASNTYALSVTGVLSLPSASLPNGTVGVAYPTQTLPGVSGGTPPYTYLATNLPPGLSFNTATREITGTPTSGGTFVVSVTGTDADNNKVSTDYTIVVNVNQPVVANASVCAGSSATLSVSNLQAGVTYNWYGPTGNTALATNNSGVFTTPAINSSTTFYVEAVSGTAVSAKTAVNISVNPAANPAVVTTNNQVVNSGQSTTLTATADAGNTIKWYAAATGGTELATGSNFTTPALSTTTTYYVETTNANGCTSNGRVAVTVTVINGGGGTACNAANAQNTGITGICLLCNVNGPGNSTDANPNNYTRISLAVGATATGFQQLIFNSAGTATDSVRLDLGLPTGLLDLSVLNNITVNLMNGAAIVGSYQLSSSVLKLAVLGGSRFTATFPAGAVYDRVELRFGGLVSAVSSLDIYGATIVYPNPTLTSGSQTICSGNTATLSATANGGTNLKWFDAATGGNLLASGATFTTPALTATTTYYIEVANGTCANTNRVPVTVTVTPVVTLPVLAPVANVCSGSTATLSVSNPDPALTYNWYTASTGGTAVFTGSTFVTPALTANTTYYLEAANGNCVSSSRVAASITVNPRPLIPTVAPSSLTVNSGQTVTLTASSSETGVTFKWYDSAASTTPIYTGATFVTPPITTTTSYYVESVSASGCASANRVQITITVNGTGTPVTVPCEAAATQINGVTGVALLAGVFNPGLAIDNDAQTASSLVMPVGALNASVYQRLYFGSLSNVGDTLKVLISFPQSLASVGVLNNIAVTSYNGANSNNDAVFLNNNLLNITLLNGNTQALITLIPTVPFDGAQLTLNSGVLGALTSVNLNYMQRALLAPQVVSSNVSGCAGLTAVLQVQNPVTGVTYRWFDASQNALTDGPTFTTPALTTDTKFYVAVVSASGCVSAKTVVNVTVQPVPGLPELLSPTVSACAGSAIVLQVKNPVNGITYKWYDANGISAGPDGTTLTVTPIASTTYTVEAVNSCGTASARATATVNIGATPQAPVITPSSATIVSGTSARLIATTSNVGATINWYSDAGTTNLVYTGTSFTTPVLTATTTYYVNTTVTGCGVSAPVPVTVTVIPPTPGTAPCGIATTTLTVGVNGINIGAGVFNQVAAVDNDVNTGSTLFIPAGIAGTSVYHRLGFSGGLSNVGDTLRVKISSPGSLLSAAVLPNLTLTTYNGGVSNADAVTLNSQLIQLDLATNGSEATFTFIPTKQFDGVELGLSSGLVGALTYIDFNYAQRSIAKPEVSATTATACQGSTALLSVNNPKPNTTYKWYQGAVYQAGKDGVTFLTDPTLAVGSYDFFVTATGGNGCESTPVKVVVTISAPPAGPTPSPGNPASTCLNTPATLSIQPVSGIIYNWYDAAVSGNLLVSNSSSFTTPANLTAGTYTYYVEAASISGCTNATRTPITLKINQDAVPSDILISGNTSLCNSGTTVLTASSTTVTSPVFTWFSDAALTNQVFVGATFTTPQITSATTYYVTVSGTNRCVNKPGNAATATITINPVAVASDINVSGISTICAGSAATLTASSVIPNAIFTWYSDANLATVVFTGPSFTTPALSADVTYYVTVKGDGKCENTPSTAKAVLININPLSTAGDINVTGLNVICKNSAAVLSASSATVTNPVFTWYNDAALTSIAYVGSSFTTPSLSATTTYYVTVKGDNNCANAAANAKIVTVTVKDYATAADITLNNVNICSGNSATLMASSLTVTQPVFTWYSDASLTVPVYTGPTYNVSVTSTTNFYVTVKGTNKCENAAADAKVVTVNVNPLATATDIIVAGNTAVCTGSSTTFTASSTTVVNPVFTWYSDAALTNISFVGAVYTTPALSSNTTYYVTVKGDNKCENAPSTARVVQVTINATPASPVISSTGTTICSGNATTLNIQNPQAGVTYEWYNSASGGSLLTTGTSFTTPVLTASTNYYVQVIGAGGCTSSAGRTMVTVTVNPQPVVPTVASNNLNACLGSAASLTVTNVQPNLTYNWYTTATGGTIAGTGATFTTPSLTNNITFYVEAVSGSCISNNRTPVNITVLPLPDAPGLVSAVNGLICSSSTAVLNVTSPDASLTYRWYNTSSGGTVLGQGTSFTTPSLTATTIFYVESVSASGCSSATRTPVTITVAPVLTAPVVRVQSTTPNSVTFTWNAVSGASGYEVSTDNGLSWQAPSNGSASTSHLITGLKPGQAVVILVRATGQIGCQTSANSTAITGNAENPIGNEIFIPNVFSPNNDGKNDIFLVYGTAIASVNMNIYTQWGQLIYQVNSTTTGWDGTYKGIAQPNGVYVYVIEVGLTDGTKVMKKGTITLIR